MKQKSILLAFSSIFLISLPAWAGGGEGGLLSPNPGLAIWTLITFFFVLVVLRAFAWKPLIESLESRTKYIEDMIKSAEEKNRKAEALMKEYEEKLEKAKKEAIEIIEEGKRDAEKLAASIKEDSKKESESLKNQTRREIDLAIQQAKEDLWKRAIDLATSLSEKIMEKTLSSQDDKKIIEKVLQEYEKN